MLRKLRITLALCSIVIITALFLNIGASYDAFLQWMPKIQVLPALLALNVAVLVLWVVLTLLFGRVYCSVICPLGIFQDLVSWLSGRGRKKKRNFTYSPEKRYLRYGIFVLYIASIIAGIHIIVTLLAPYATYGRIVTNLFAPLYPTFIIAGIFLLILVILSWRNGRTYCNIICPVGTLLSFFARFAILRPVLNVDKCKNCGLCSNKCKASCIDLKKHQIDYNRCVVCMNCVDTCKHDALTYKCVLNRKSHKEEQPLPTKPSISLLNKDTEISQTRRNFISTLSLAFVATSTVVAASSKGAKQALATIEGDKNGNDNIDYQRATPITPAGSLSAQNFAAHCIACQLCVSACPQKVLKPSSDLSHFMQPEMNYTNGHCDVDCTRCADVCPSGAIRPITKEQKYNTRIGHAEWIRKNCITQTEDEVCIECARNCPAGAIEMIAADFGKGDDIKVPSINARICIGCGACENSCPAKPFKAIYVEGHSVHSVSAD